MIGEMIDDDDDEKMKSESVVYTWEFHVEDSQKNNSTWNFFSVDLIEGLSHIQITDGIPIFSLETGSKGLQDPIRAFLTLAL